MSEDGFIYAIRSAGHVKIGWSGNPKSRFLQVKVHCPFICELVGYFPGSMAEEAALHIQFAEYRRNGEWFEIGGPVAKWLSDVSIPAPEFDPNMHPLKAWRYRTQTKQEELAQLLGITHAAVAHMECGRNGASLDIALKILKLCGPEFPLESLLPTKQQEALIEWREAAE